jgi:L,D-transpeptidase catalytic domain
VNRKIILISIAICPLVFYFYAYHNWDPLPAGTTIDRIVVEKSAKRLLIFRDGNQIKSYRIALGRNPVGAKREEGDMKTPEGIYKIDSRNPQSSFHLALHILIRQMKTTNELPHAASQPVLTLWFTEFKTVAAGLVRFIVGKIGLRVASHSPTKKSRNSGV